MRFLTITFFAVLVLLSLHHAQATIIHVPADSSTIQGGINGAVSGDTVLVAPGTYFENIIWPLMDQVVLISDEGADSTIIDGNLSTSVIEISNPSPQSGPIEPLINASIIGFTILNGLENGIYLHGSVSAEVRRSIIKDNFGIGLYCSSLGWSGGYVQIVRTLLADNSKGMEIWGGMQSWDVISDKLTIPQNTQSAIEFLGAPECVTFLMTNSIVWGNNQSFSGGTPGTLSVMYSDIENSWPGEGNICCNPQFCYPDTDNYYLGQNSCCIGAGCDSLGNPDSTIDLGAFGVGCQGYVYGDANGDGVIDLGDVVYLINYLYRDGDPPNPIEAGDANCDGTVDLGDAVYLLNYLFRGGPPPSC